MLNIQYYHKYNVEIKTSPFSALTAACQSGLHEVVILLLDRGASIQASNNRGMPPLLCAARAGMCAIPPGSGLKDLMLRS